MSPAHSIFHRLTHVERLDVNSASHDRLAWLGQNNFRGDMILQGVIAEDREAVMFEVQGLVVAEYSATLKNHIAQVEATLSAS